MSNYPAYPHSMRWQRTFLSALLAAVLLAGSVPSSAPAYAALPNGVGVGIEGSCLIRDGGHRGYNVRYQFDWSYSEAANYGPQITVSGSYSVEIHNPTTDAFETLAAFPYGFTVAGNTTETRNSESDARTRLRTTDPHPIFDRMRLTNNWRVEETASTGVESIERVCDVQPPPAGKQPITEKVSKAAEGPADSEDFASTSDPSPYSALTVDSWLLCWNRSAGKQDIHWGYMNSNDGIGGDGVALDGNIRVSFRAPGQEYHVVHSEAFGHVLAIREGRIIDGYIGSRGNFSVKLEVEWRASVGAKVDSAASVQRISRTIACVEE